MKTLALLDADIIAYQCAAANASAGGDLACLHHHLQATTEEWTKASGAEDYRLYATFGPTFRHHFYPPYKQNRVGKPKPRGLKQAREWLKAHPKCVWEEGYEADDLIATAATCPDCKKQKVIVSTDKDFRQVWGVPIYNPTKDETVEVTEEEANLFRLEQWLCGDSVDGYGGIPRYGPKTFAKKIKENPPEDWADMDLFARAAYANYEASADHAVDYEYVTQMLVCATILSHQIPKGHQTFVRGIVADMKLVGTSP